MNTKRTALRSEGEEIAIAGAAPQGNRNYFHLQAAAKDNVPVNPPAVMDCKVREALF